VTDVPVLRADGLTVRRGRRVVLSGVSFALAAGEGVRLTGANGSGKTSLLRVLARLTPASRGNVACNSAYAFVPEKVTLAPALRCGEWLTAMRGLRGLAPIAWEPVLFDGGLDAELLRRPAAVLSKGMTQRLALLEAIASRCDLLLLDEPFSGLDGDGRDWLGERIGARLADGAAVLLSDHSGAALGRLGETGELALRDGRCERAAPGGARRRPVTVLATHPDGRRVERAVPEDGVDRLLRELLDDGWNVREVRP
jgi:ABC-2 type transport system ATP-binding protein